MKLRTNLRGSTSVQLKEISMFIAGIVFFILAFILWILGTIKFFTSGSANGYVVPLALCLLLSLLLIGLHSCLST